MNLVNRIIAFLRRRPLPHSIVIGDDPDHPAFRVSRLADPARFHAAGAAPAGMAYGGRLSAAIQALPSMLVERAHRGKHLMEVVINGDLIQAADGFGKRAMAIGANGKISEHARLFDVAQLPALVSVAAVWQIASVVVAQKHLADISQKLDAIGKGVTELGRWLDESRRAVITGSCAYLRQALTAIENGELSASIRGELEHCERHLLEVQHHLEAELLRLASEPCGHAEFAGTADLERDTLQKYATLRRLAADLRVTLETRALAWYVLSLYPGEQALKAGRRDAVLGSAADIDALLETIKTHADADCNKLSSWWNRRETVEIRKLNVREAATALIDDLAAISGRARDRVAQIQGALLQQQQPVHLVFEIDEGKMGELRMAAPARAGMGGAAAV